MRKCGDNLVASRKKNPALQVKPASKIEKRLHGAFFVTKVRNAEGAGGESWEARNGMLVVNHADRHTEFTQTSDNPEALVIATNHDGARRLGLQRPEVASGKRACRS